MDLGACARPAGDPGLVNLYGRYFIIKTVMIKTKAPDAASFPQRQELFCCIVFEMCGRTGPDPHAGRRLPPRNSFLFQAVKTGSFR